MMPHVSVSIGGRSFDVACQPGEEAFLQNAAALLDEEASSLVSQIGRMPESKMLLMAGLMLADKTAGVGDVMTAMEEKIKTLEAELAAARAQEPQTVTVEVPVVPAEVAQALADMTARAEALADQIEEQATS